MSAGQIWLAKFAVPVYFSASLMNMNIMMNLPPSHPATQPHARVAQPPSPTPVWQPRSIAVLENDRKRSKNHSVYNGLLHVSNKIDASRFSGPEQLFACASYVFLKKSNVVFSKTNRPMPMPRSIAVLENDRKRSERS